jgi:hypothetical protein
MDPEMRAQSFEEIADTSISAEDRRTHDRLTLMKTIQISCLDPAGTQETATVVDISRHYQIGMEMRVTIPSLEFEGVCRVVRIEELPSGCLGIGSLILGW